MPQAYNLEALAEFVGSRDPIRTYTDERGVRRHDGGVRCNGRMVVFERHQSGLVGWDAPSSSTDGGSGACEGCGAVAKW